MSKSQPVMTNPADVVKFLYERFDAKKASDEDLKFLTGAAEESFTLARAVATTVLSASAYVYDDFAVGKETKYVNGTELSEYLLSVANSLYMVAELSEIAHDASFISNLRLIQKASKASRRFAISEQSIREAI